MKTKIKIGIFVALFTAVVFSFNVFGAFIGKTNDAQLKSIFDDETVSDSLNANSNFRKPKNDADLKYWLENMVYYHHFTNEEISEATGLTSVEIEKALKKFKINDKNKPKLSGKGNLVVVPYPGGRHPRIGFLEGAINPQRETKISVFTPWNPDDYVVVDVPEAIWSDLGLTYLAHTHVPTIWTEKNIQLKKMEWERKANGVLTFERRLPDGIVFGTKVTPHKDHVEMIMWLKNGTDKTLSDLKVQNCVMLKNAEGFTALSDSNKIYTNPYVATHSENGNKWIITAWTPCVRPWGNPKVPCMHSDPQFPDCKPGETKYIKGWLSFYEGNNIQAEFKRIEQTGWSR